MNKYLNPNDQVTEELLELIDYFIQLIQVPNKSNVKNMRLFYESDEVQLFLEDIYISTYYNNDFFPIYVNVELFKNYKLKELFEDLVIALHNKKDTVCGIDFIKGFNSDTYENQNHDPPNIHFDIPIAVIEKFKICNVKIYRFNE